MVANNQYLTWKWEYNRTYLANLSDCSLHIFEHPAGLSHPKHTSQKSIYHINGRIPFPERLISITM